LTPALLWTIFGFFADVLFRYASPIARLTTTNTTPTCRKISACGTGIAVEVELEETVMAVATEPSLKPYSTISSNVTVTHEENAVGLVET